MYKRQVWNGPQFSARIKLALAVLLLGVGIATVTDLELNFLGSQLSAAAVVTTCVSQIWTGTMQKNYSVSSTQLLFAAAPYMALTLGAGAFDGHHTGPHTTASAW